MNILEQFSNWFTYNLLNLTQGNHLAESVVFFVNDVLKILILLILVTHFMSWLRHYLPMDKFKKFLTSHKFYGADYLLASSFGAITPFCSCSSIPLFIGFLQAGIPLGVTFSFLITSPLINEIAVVLFLSLFGWKITILYVLAGLLVGVVGGFVLQKLKMEKYLIPFEEVKKNCCCGCKPSTKMSRCLIAIKHQLRRLFLSSTQPTSFLVLGKKAKPNKKQIFVNISTEAWGIVRKVVLYIIAGVALGAIIHGFVPANFFESYLQTAGVFAVPLAVILAVPLYSNASGVIPVIQALIAKGVSIGTGLAFMMAVVGLSLPEALILKKVMKLKLLLTFFGIVTLGIIFIGYLFNIIL
ncbi:MAG: permease [Candidatus Magasanikbacteria bacterium]